MNSNKRIVSYRDLDVWQKAMDLAVECYRLTAGFPQTERFGLVDQMRRAAVSNVSNIAEGHAHSTRTYLHHLAVSTGSVNELDTQLELSLRLQFAADETAQPMRILLDIVGRQLHALVASLRRICPDA